ncbi:hypothetical protein TNCV_220301 [Trichonephila clavipes]|nr:hypothetical protein TNCV_220301 [Trichonephila clavipes]
MFALWDVPVSAAAKKCRSYPLDPCPDAVALYSGCTPGKRRAWALPDDRPTSPLVELRGGWRHANMSKKSPFVVHKALIGIGSGLESVKRLRSSDLVQTNSTIQINRFFSPKPF